MAKFNKRFERKIKEAYEKVFHRKENKCLDCGTPIKDIGGSGLCFKCFVKRTAPNVIEAIDEEQRKGM